MPSSGVSWWPFRHARRGLHPLWATALIVYPGRSAGLLALRPPRWASCCATRAVAAGAVLGRDQRGLQLGRDRGRRGARGAAVLPHARLGRAAGLAHAGERPTPTALLPRLALAFAGVLLVLWPAGAGHAAWPRAGLADALALLGASPSR